MQCIQFASESWLKQILLVLLQIILTYPTDHPT